MNPNELTMTAEDLGKAMAKAVTDAIAPLKEVMEKGFERKDINGDGQDKTDLTKLVGIEKCAKWLNAIASGDMFTVKALSEGVGADGGFLVPTEFRAIVVEKLHKLSVIRPNAQIIPMGRNKLEVPTEGSAVTASWKAENSALTESNPTLGQIVLDTNKLTGLAKMSRELFADSAINLVNYVAMQYAKAFAKEEDKAFMAGSGTGEPKGIRTYTIASVAQAGASLVADDLISLFYALPSQYRKNASWLLHNSIIQKVRKLKDTDGRYLWTDGLNDAPATILGRPVLEQNDIPTNLGAGTDESEVFLGDLSYYLIGDRQSMETETSTEAGDAFVNHQLWMKVVERLDGQLSQTEAFHLLTGVK